MKTPTERDNLVEALRSAREGVAPRVSKADIARRAGVTRMMIGHVERGLYPPTPRVLRAYAAACRLNADDLFHAWGYIPDDVLRRVQQEPRTWALIRSFA